MSVDVFDNRAGITEVWHCINIEAVLIFLINVCLYLKKSRFCSANQRFAYGLVCSTYPASSRVYLAVDILSFVYILPATRRILVLHRIETCVSKYTIKATLATQDLEGGVEALKTPF